MVPWDEMCLSARKLRDTYAVKPGAPFYQKTFGLWMCLETWYANGLARDTDLDELFMFDKPGFLPLHQLGWCESAFDPVFENEVIEDRGECELVRDRAGRHVLYFKGKRQGFMPEYMDHPVKDEKTWTEDVKWRLDSKSAGRHTNLAARMAAAGARAAEGIMIQQDMIGGYMYLRSLMGPEALLYVFYDNPKLVHDVQIDTDGNCVPVIDLYVEGIGMDMLDPFEVASGCDVVEIGKQWPDLVMSGGIDKRILATDTDTMDRYLESILPVMRRRGGYIPTCDHGVPPEVTWENYLHYRKRCVEYGS